MAGRCANSVRVSGDNQPSQLLQALRPPQQPDTAARALSSPHPIIAANRASCSVPVMQGYTTTQMACIVEAVRAPSSPQRTGQCPLSVCLLSQVLPQVRQEPDRSPTAHPPPDRSAHASPSRHPQSPGPSSFASHHPAAAADT